MSWSRESALTLYRFGVTGAALGFLVGLGEATSLSTHPDPAVLLKPSVGHAIWLIAPLTGAFCLGLLGLAMGVIAGLSGRLQSRLGPYSAAVGMGNAFVYAGAAFGFLHAHGQGLRGAATRPEVWIGFTLGFLTVWLPYRPFYSFTARWFGSKWDRGMAWTARVMVVLLVACLAGLLLYRVRSSGDGAQPSAGVREAVARPNIILISLDTVRADHLSSYGYYRPTTPRLDDLARRGALFENAIVSAPWTLASHASIFTELLPHQHGANWAVPLHPGPWPLAKVLKNRGYATGGFSSNLRYGFAGWGMDQGFDHYGDDSASLRHNLCATLLGRTILQPLYERFVHVDDFDRLDARHLNREVSKWLARTPDRPFFLFINYFDAHGPYIAPPPYDRRFGRLPPSLEGTLPRLSAVRNPQPLSEADRELFSVGYDNCLAFLDAQVGELIDRLRSQPGWSNTYVIITSDHGEEFGEHGSYGHGWNLYREVVHVPLIIVGPNVPAGLRVSPLARTRDLFVTVLDFALKDSGFTTHRSLRRFWTPGWKPPPWDDMAISELDATVDPSGTVAISLMTSEWHYIREVNGRTELYHWPADPQERVNLAQTPAHQPVLQDLSARLACSVEATYPPWRGPEYLSALDQPGIPFLRHSIFRSEPRPGFAPGLPRVGSAQMRLARDSAARVPLRHSVDEELLKSLPYR